MTGPEEQRPGPRPIERSTILSPAINHYLANRTLLGQNDDAARRSLVDWIDLGTAPAEQVRTALSSLAEMDDLRAKGAGPIIRGLDSIRREKIDWAVEGWVPLRKFSQIAGDPKLGKSIVALSWAAAISHGRPWPNEHGVPTKLGSTIIFSSEDDPADTIRPRLEELDADMRRIKVFDGVRVPKGSSGEVTQEHFSATAHLQYLEMALDTLGDVRLVIFDPIVSFGGTIDTNSNHEVRRLLDPIVSLAQRRNLAVLAINHLNKNDRGSSIYRAMGSLAYTAVSRTILTVAKDRQNPERRFLLREGNLIRSGSPGLAFTVTSGKDSSIPVIAWEKDEITITADEALASPDAGGREDGERARARAFLLVTLANGQVPSLDLQALAREQRLSERTLRRGEEDLGVRSRRIGDRWFKHLPGNEDQVGQGGPGTHSMASLATLELKAREDELSPSSPAASKPSDPSQGGQGGHLGQGGRVTDFEASGEAEPPQRPSRTSTKPERGQGGQDGHVQGAATFAGGRSGDPKEDGQRGLFGEESAVHDDGSEVGGG